MTLRDDGFKASTEEDGLRIMHWRTVVGHMLVKIFGISTFDREMKETASQGGTRIAIEVQSFQVWSHPD